jgi:outer membrane protein assembly factor BamA
MRNSLLSFSLILLCVAGSVGGIRAQQPGQTFHLAKIEFTGLERLKLDEAIAASGLTVGQTVDEAGLDAAANTLVQSGMFKTLTYKLHADKDQQATVTFVVEEATVRLPVTFDNFIWFTDDELFAAVRKEVPGFDGTAPETGDLVEGIKRALLAQLRKKKVAGSVDFAPIADVSQRVIGMAFQFRGDALNVCLVHFPGASEINETVLQKNSKLLLGKEYSRSYAGGVAQESLIPLYRKLGMLKAAFGTPQGKPGSGEACANGVEVTVPVEEGAIYHLSAIEWAGIAVFEAPELTHALDMKPGDLADGLKIDAGYATVRKTYGTKGYIEVKITPTPEYDDAKQLVGYHIGVVEGPQYLMGNLTITGLPEETIANLRAKWRLQPGDVYDDSYLKTFLDTQVFRDQTVAALLRKEGLTKSDTSVKTDRDKHTVAVTLKFARP